VQFTDGCAFHALSSAELYHPDAGGWTPVDRLGTARLFHTATLLASGRVLVVGGRKDTDAGTTLALASAELYDPATRTWTPTGSLTTGRYRHTATLLPSGKVLVAGGGEAFDAGCNSLSLGSAELYDPDTGTWSPTGALVAARSWHTATLLPSGQVLVSGGCCGPGGTLASAELYDPDAGTWSPTGSLVGPRLYHVATLTPSGKVLVEGGLKTPTWLASAEIYEPARGTWESVASMPEARAFNSATVLPTVGVLVAGGDVPIDGGPGNVGFAVASTLIYAGETLAISPASVALLPGGMHGFVASGGSGSGYVWNLVANRSGGTLSQTGEYVAGSVGHVTDYVGVTDSAGNTATAAVLVIGPAPAPDAGVAPDAGGGGAPDAGSGGNGGGTTSTSGCSSTGGDGMPLALLLGSVGLMLLASRRRS
jgi:hypothetical protein